MASRCRVKLDIVKLDDVAGPAMALLMSSTLTAIAAALRQPRAARFALGNDAGIFCLGRFSGDILIGNFRRQSAHLTGGFLMKSVASGLASLSAGWKLILGGGRTRPARFRILQRTLKDSLGPPGHKITHQASAQPSRRGSEPASSMPVGASRRMISTLHGPSRSPTVLTG